MTARSFTGEIYLHWNPITDKGYVGQTSGTMLERWRGHIKERRNRAFSNAIRKYGPDAFEHQVLSVADSQSQLDNLERIWIILLQTKAPNGYNLTAGGEAGTLGYKHTPEALEKISRASASRTMSVEAREKIAAAHRGVPLSPEHRAKLALSSRTRIRKPCSMETRKKIAQALTGKPLSALHRANVGNAQRGKKQSEKRKANTSKAITAWWTARKAEVDHVPQS
jgi:group I intron endonuclease